MAKFVGNLVLSTVVISVAVVVLRSLPDLARYLKIREM